MKMFGLGVALLPIAVFLYLGWMLGHYSYSGHYPSPQYLAAACLTLVPATIAIGIGYREGKRFLIVAGIWAVVSISGLIVYAAAGAIIGHV